MEEYKSSETRHCGKGYETQIGYDYQLWLTIDQQSFKIAGTGKMEDEEVNSLENAKWYQKQLNKALDRLTNTGNAEEGE